MTYRLIALLLACLCSAHCADLALQRHLTLGPSPGNPRNSEGDFIQLNDGRLVFVYTHFTSGNSDHAKAHLASRVSADRGQTWSASDEIVVANEGGYNVMSVSLLRLRSGAIALFYLRKNSMQDCRPIMRISRDEAKTWGEPVECITENIGYYVLNNSRVIQLANGRLVMPTALHGFEKGKLLPGAIVTFLSDDDGTTWRRSGTVLENDPSGTRVNLMEPGVVEVTPDHLLMLIRTQLGAQFFSESKDQGATWSGAAPTALLSPVSPATIKKIPSTGDLLVVWNDHAGQPEEYRRANPPVRNPFAAAISRDGGKTWSKSKILEDEPRHGYCYTAMTFVGDRVLLAYCAHPAPWGLETTQISSFKVDDLYR